MINFKRYILLFVLVCFCVFTYAQSTVITGIITDHKTGEGLPFASVYFTGTSSGVTTDLNGNYEISTSDQTLKSLTFHYLGYKERVIKIKPGITQVIDAKIKQEASYELGTATVKAKRKVKKDTAAITLYRNVVRNKSNNRSGGLDYYYYQDYSKTEFDVFNVKEKFTQRKIFKPFRFVFNYIDSTDVGKPFLPMLLKEQISDVYYRKDPSKRKEFLKATRFSGFKDFSRVDGVEEGFPDADMYANIINIQSEAFLSPFANGALTSYKYFLEDSTMIDDRWSYKLEFTPRRKADLAFTGHAWIDAETFALKSMDLYLLKQANLNFVSDLLMRQRFDLVDGHWFKTFDQTEVYLNLTQSKRHMSMRVLRTLHRDKIEINQAYPDSLFAGDPFIGDWNAYKRSREHWDTIRPKPLTKTERGVYFMIDSLQQTRAYKNTMWTGHLLATGWARVGPLEFGKWYNTFSWNDVEGNRFRLGMRNSRFAFKQKLELNTYLAYGTKDKIVKYHGGFKYHLPRKNQRWQSVGAYYRKDYSNFNFYSPWDSHDYIVKSILRGPNQLLANSLYLQKEGQVFYEKEWFQGFKTTVSGTHKTVMTWPDGMKFTSPRTGEEFISDSNPFQTVEFKLRTEWSVGIKFNNTIRNPRASANSVKAHKPYFKMDYTYSPSGVMGSDYQYHRLELSVTQQLRSRIGRTYYQLEGGRIFGEVPSPLFRIHSGNQSYAYNRWVYNMMNDREYGGDIWASAWFTHRFRGLFFNMIPWNNFLRFRSLVHGKVLYSRVSPDNILNVDPDGTGNNLQDLNGVYAEIGVGIENIARFLKVDFMWRLTQRDEERLPGNEISKFGIKLEFSPSF